MGEERGIEGREGGSDDARQVRERQWRQGGLREGGLMKERGMDSAKER